MSPHPRFPTAPVPVLQPLDVLRPDPEAHVFLSRPAPASGCRRAAAPRLLLCLDPASGLHLPLDTPAPGIPRVVIPRLDSHDWADADIHAECDPVTLAPEGIARSEVVGYIDLVHIPAILDGLTRARRVPRATREHVARILHAFEAANPDA